MQEQTDQQKIKQLEIDVWELKKRLREFERLHLELQDGIKFLKSILGE